MLFIEQMSIESVPDSGNTKVINTGLKAVP